MKCIESMVRADKMNYMKNHHLNSLNYNIEVAKCMFNSMSFHINICYTLDV